MAKGTKRKKTGVGIDFRRVKSKVGKKLPKAQNETDMTFKARSINLPGQSLTEDKSGLAVSQRNLTTQELLSQTSHYSERVRKDAMTGMQQLFLQHPEEIRKQTGTLLGKLAECIGDADRGVRTALKDLLSNSILAQLKGSMLGPFLPLVMAHLFSALTSMSEPVRTGALDFLELFMDAAPRQVMQSYLEPALQHFVELLSPARRANSVAAHSISSMLKVVKGLHSLLSKAAAAQSVPTSLSHTASPPASPQHGKQTLFHQRCQWPPIVAATDVSALVQAAQTEVEASSHVGEMSAAASKAADRRAKHGAASKPDNKAVGEVLLQELMSCWTECAPGQLAAGPELTAVQCMEATLQCVDILLHHLPNLFPTGVASASIDTIVRKVTPHMPASAPAVKPSQQMQAALVQLNLAAAKLLSRFLPTRLGDEEDEEEGWRVRLLDYYVGIMESGQVLPSRRALSEDVKQASMPVDVCTAALQGVQGVLPFVSPARRATLLAAVCTLSHRSAARSAVKAACLTFQQALLAQGGQVLYPDPMTGVTLLPEAVLIEWLQAIPRLLWELGSSRPATSHMALGLLHSALRFAPEGSALSSMLDGLQPQLCPLYCSLLAPKAAKGTNKGARDGAKPGKVVVPGPLAQLPADSQELAVDLLYYYPSLHEATARTCAVVCLTDTYTVQLALRVIVVLSARERQEEELTLISFLVTVLLGQVSQAQLSVDRARHAVMVQAVCRAISRVASLGDMLQAMEPVLVQHSSATAGVLAWQGTVALTTVAAETLKASGRTLKASDSAQADSALDTSMSSTSSQQHQSVEAGPFASNPRPPACKSEPWVSNPTASASDPAPSAISPSFWAALPCVMAYLSLHREQEARINDSFQQHDQSHQQQGEQLQLVMKLLQADPLLISPFITALVTYCQRVQTQPAAQSGVTQQSNVSTEHDASQVMSASTMPAADITIAGGHEQQAAQAHDVSGVGQHEAGLVHHTYRLVAAIETLLALCEQPGLPPYLLELQHQLFQACRDFRDMAEAIGAASQAGAAAIRKCESLVTVLEGLTGATKRA